MCSCPKKGWKPEFVVDASLATVSYCKDCGAARIQMVSEKARWAKARANAITNAQDPGKFKRYPGRARRDPGEFVSYRMNLRGLNPVQVDQAVRDRMRSKGEGQVEPRPSDPGVAAAPHRG